MLGARFDLRCEVCLAPRVSSTAQTPLAEHGPALRGAAWITAAPPVAKDEGNEIWKDGRRSCLFPVACLEIVRELCLASKRIEPHFAGENQRNIVAQLILISLVRRALLRQRYRKGGCLRRARFWESGEWHRMLPHLEVRQCSRLADHGKTDESDAHFCTISLTRGNSEDLSRKNSAPAFRHARRC